MFQPKNVCAQKKTTYRSSSIKSINKVFGWQKYSVAVCLVVVGVKLSCQSRQRATSFLHTQTHYTTKKKMTLY